MNGKFYIYFIFLAIKVQRKSESDDSVEYVSTYIQQDANDSIIYQGMVKNETSSYMADDSSPDTSAQTDVSIDYSKQLYELYNSRRNSIAVDVGSVVQAEDQINGLYLSSNIEY